MTVTHATDIKAAATALTSRLRSSLAMLQTQSRHVRESSAQLPRGGDDPIYEKARNAGEVQNQYRD